MATRASTEAITTKVKWGIPGIAANARHNPATTNRALYCPKNWAPMSEPNESSSFSEATRVTTMPAATAMEREGICETSPSPMLMRAYVPAASLAVMPF